MVHQCVLYLFTVAPEVSVQAASNPIGEGSQLTLTCEVEEGNPAEFTSQFWEFEPKYPDTQSQALPGQRENRELRIERAVYGDAGIYRCTAGNTIGSDAAEMQIVVHCKYKFSHKIKA